MSLLCATIYTYMAYTLYNIYRPIYLCINPALCTTCFSSGRKLKINHSCLITTRKGCLQWVFYLCVYTIYIGYIAHTHTCVLRKLARTRSYGFNIAFIHIGLYTPIRAQTYLKDTEYAPYTCHVLTLASTC